MTSRLLLPLLLAGFPLLCAEPPGLPELVRQALELNLDLLASRQTAEAARGSLLATQGLFDPALALTPQWTRDRQTLVLPGPAFLKGSNTYSSDSYGLGLAGATRASTSYSLDLQSQRDGETAPLLEQPYGTQWSTGLTLALAQPLLRGFGRAIATAPVEQARLALGSADALVRDQADQVVGAVEQAYAQFEYAAVEARLAAESLARTRRLLDQLQTQRQAKVISRLDLLSVQEAVANRESTLAAARLARANAVEALLGVVYGGKLDAALATEAPRLDPDPSGPPAALAAPELPPLESCERDALARRQAILAARLSLAQSQLQYQVARDNLKPALTVTGSYGAQGLNTATSRLDAGLRPGDRGLSGWTLGVTLGVSVFNRAARGAAQNAAAQVRLRSLTVQSQEQQVRLAVRQAHHGIRAAQDQLASALQARDLSRERYQGETERLALGFSDPFRLLQMELQLVTDEATVAQARLQLETAVSSFRVAMGTAADPFVQ